MPMIPVPVPGNPEGFNPPIPGHNNKTFFIPNNRRQETFYRHYIWEDINRDGLPELLCLQGDGTREKPIVIAAFQFDLDRNLIQKFNPTDPRWAGVNSNNNWFIGDYYHLIAAFFAAWSQHPNNFNL